MEEEPLTLKDRLLEHSKAFDGLLSLIPAKLYYGEDTTDQWMRKKQTKAAAKAARLGKLDPDSELNRTAKEVMDERAKRKRKLDEVDEDEGSGNAEADDSLQIEKETPGQGLKKTENASPPKKRKMSAKLASELSETKKAKLEKKRLKLQKNKERKKRKVINRQERQEILKAATSQDDEASNPKPPKPDAVDSTPATGNESGSTEAPKQNQKKGLAEAVEKGTGDLREVNISAVSELPSPPPSTLVSTPPADPTTTFESTATGENLSTAAPEAAPAAVATDEAASVSTDGSANGKTKPRLKIPEDTAAFRARFNARMETLRAARNADGKKGRPPQTRQELIEQRRAKEAERKAHKKELRRQQREAEKQARDEALAASAANSSRNSPLSMMSPALANVDEGAEWEDAADDTNFSFGRVAFTDGATLSHDLGRVLTQPARKKGPSDPATALRRLEAEKARLDGMETAKRADVEEKEAWLAARRRAEGGASSGPANARRGGIGLGSSDKIKEEETLLKKALKRKEKQKRRSEKEWAERARGVDSAQKAKQKKRDDNIRRRKDDKLERKLGGKKKKGGVKKKGRPGFEGSFGVGGKKKQK